MAIPKQVAKGIVVESAGTVIRLRKKPKGTASLFAKRPSRGLLMEQACDEQVANLASIIKAWRIGQKSKLNNCLKHFYRQSSKLQSSMKFSLPEVFLPHHRFRSLTLLDTPYYGRLISTELTYNKIRIKLNGGQNVKIFFIESWQEISINQLQFISHNHNWI